MGDKSDSSNDVDFGGKDIDRAYQPYQEMNHLQVLGWELEPIENIGCETDIDRIVDITDESEKLQD